MSQGAKKSHYSPYTQTKQNNSLFYWLSWNTPKCLDIPSFKSVVKREIVCIFNSMMKMYKILIQLAVGSENGSREDGSVGRGCGGGLGVGGGMCSGMGRGVRLEGWRGVNHLVPGPVQKGHLGCFPLLQQQRLVRQGSKIKNTRQSQAGTRVGGGKDKNRTHHSQERTLSLFLCGKEI